MPYRKAPAWGRRRFNRAGRYLYNALILPTLAGEMLTLGS